MNTAMKLASLLPLRILDRVTGVNPLVINYHMVSDQVLPYVWPVYHYRNIIKFRQDLDFLCRYYHPLGIRDLISHRKTGTPLPERSFMITFDDGFREIYDIAAGILKEKEVPATFFITKNFVDNKELNYDNKKGLIVDKIQKNENLRREVQRLLNVNEKTDLSKEIFNLPVTMRNQVDRILDVLEINIPEFLREVKPYLTSQQIKALINDGFTFGGHSIDHPDYAELNSDEQVQQTVESIKFVTEKFGIDYRVFAFPYSDRSLTTGFFKRIKNEADLTFGTHGLHEDVVDNNIQRISVEKLPYASETTVKFFYFKRLVYSITGKNKINRRSI